MMIFDMPANAVSSLGKKFAWRKRERERDEKDERERESLKNPAEEENVAERLGRERDRGCERERRT